MLDDVVGDFQNRFMWTVFEKTKVSATTPGPRELQNWPTYKDLVAGGTIPVISSNLKVRTKDGSETPLGVPYKIFTINGVKVAVMGLMGGGEFATVPKVKGTEFAFQDPFQQAAAMVPALHKKAELVVLMSQMSPTDTDRLIATVPGIDVALYGQRPSYDQDAKKVGGTIVNQTGVRGQYVGDLVVIVDPAGKVTDFGSKNITLDSTVPEDQTVAKSVSVTNDKITQMRADNRAKTQGEFESKLSQEHFLGTETCKRCHAAEYDQWAASPHGHAFASLDKPVKGKQRSDDCLTCHTTGLGQAGGYQVTATSTSPPPEAGGSASASSGQPDMTNVGCESCHGMGTLHQRTGAVHIEEATCRTCHTSEWSPKFDFKTALAAVKHKTS